MKKLTDIKGVIFDYGGTLDTNGRHWSEVLWDAYVRAGVPVAKARFRAAYVHGERTLALNPLVRPHHTFLDVLRIKVGVELAFLTEQADLPSDSPCAEWTETIARDCYGGVKNFLQSGRKVVERLHSKHKLVLVSNFYGNISTVLADFGLLRYFEAIVESSVVGVRKPDPRIYALGVEAMGFRPDEIAVVGDSYAKDMVPASKVGCHTVWLRGQGWAEEEVDETLPDVVVGDFAQLSEVFGLEAEA